MPGVLMSAVLSPSETMDILNIVYFSKPKFGMSRKIQNGNFPQKYTRHITLTDREMSKIREIHIQKVFYIKSVLILRTNSKNFICKGNGY